MTDPKNISNVKNEPAEQRRYADRVLGTFAVMLGIVTVIMGMIPAVGWFSFIPGAIGIFIGIISISQAVRAHVSSRMAVLGIVLSVVGILTFVIPRVIMASDERRIPEHTEAR